VQVCIFAGLLVEDCGKLLLHMLNRCFNTLLQAFGPTFELSGHPRQAWLVGNFTNLHGSTSILKIWDPNTCKGNISYDVYNSSL